MSTPSTAEPAELRARFDFARQIARQAGQLTLRYYRQPGVATERKSDNSPVTIADREAELLLRKLIAEAFPADTIVGEEFPKRDGTSGYTWILDPIDGTKSFISGVPLYGCMVGVTHGEQSVIGVLDFPPLDECLYAARGEGAWVVRGKAAPERAKVAPIAKLKDGLLVTSEVKTFNTRGARGAWEELEQAAWLLRTWGDCYGYALVATGRAAAMIDPILNVWDAAAVQPILEEAGGAFVDWQGRPTIHAGEAIGCAPGVLEEILAITRGFPKPS